MRRGLTFMTLVLTSVLVYISTIHPATAAHEPRIVEAIDETTLRFVDGGRLRISPEVEVVKKGYDLTMKDVKPGWAIAPARSSSDGSVRKIEVVGIPVTRTWPAYTGVRDTVAVARAELGFMPAVQALAGVDVQQALETLAASVLKATGRFVVVDLASRDEILNEQDFAHTGYANPEAAPKGERMIAARYLLKVAVVDFDHATRSGNAGGAFGISIAKNKTRSQLALDMRLTEVTTGIVKASARISRSFGADATQVRVNLSETAASIAPWTGAEYLKDVEKLAAAGVTVAHNGFVQSPIGELFSLTVNEGVEQLINELPADGWQSVIVNVIDSDRVVIRGGKDAGMKPGSMLTVRQSSAPLTDPETGEILGSLSRATGSVRITEVLDKVSVAHVISGASPKRGDVCLLEGAQR